MRATISAIAHYARPFPFDHAIWPHAAKRKILQTHMGDPSNPERLVGKTKLSLLGGTMPNIQGRSLGSRSNRP